MKGTRIDWEKNNKNKKLKEQNLDASNEFRYRSVSEKILKKGGCISGDSVKISFPKVRKRKGKFVGIDDRISVKKSANNFSFSDKSWANYVTTIYLSDINKKSFPRSPKKLRALSGKTEKELRFMAKINSVFNIKMAKKIWKNSRK